MKEEVEGEGTMEQRIQQAMRSRVQHFRDQADSLTFEGVRRVLEKDLELDTCALDVHKRYVKQLLEKFLNGAEDEKISKDTGKKTLEKVKEEAEPTKEHEMKEDVKELNSREENKMEDSPVMGLLTGNKSGNSEAQGKENKEIPSETTVIKAIWKRAVYLKSKSEEITVAGVRRLLEEDLQLEKYSLDPLKKLISKQLDEVLNSPTIPKSVTPIKKKSSSDSQSKPETTSKDSSDSSDNESDNEEDEEEDEAPKKKGSTKAKIQKSEGVKKRKRPTKEAQVSRKKQIKVSKEASEENTDGDDSSGDDSSEDDQSRSSARKTVKKKEVSPPTYGKKVEHLKSIIKACGMSVAPVLYKKAKQLPDNKREGFLIKELEEILAKEGLSADPSEKEIKDVKRRKDRAKELEGIDTSNIVLSSRRRSATSFVAPPKPKSPVKKDGDDAEGSDNEDSDEDDDDDGDDSDSESEEPQEDEDSD